ncbi:hypothetical protein CASFOL_017243 [Castilleja foliolosa]|uniref:FBD domain-containing protein n=1 Tax=Castilleja foliolosa TaxID=1961234 RepID=A0ABD3DAJ8_9LAMI
MENDDLFGRLKDDFICCQILSFMPTRDSVSTCVLSKRWESLWQKVPALYFKSDRNFRGFQFAASIDRVMARQQGEGLTKFTLDCRASDCQHWQCEIWIAEAIERKVEHMNVVLYGTALTAIETSRRWFPECLVRSATLVTLNLGYCVLPSFDGDVCLPALKVLSLEQVRHTGEQAFMDLVHGSPLLEELTFDGFSADRCSKLSLNNVKTLNMDLLAQIPSRILGFSIQITAPKLVSLKLKACVSSRILFHKVEALVTAVVLIDKKHEIPLHPSIFGMVDSLSFVEDMTLMVNLKLHRPSGNTSIRTFNNCTKLVLDVDWTLMSNLLQCAERLESLLIRNIFARKREWANPTEVPKCMLWSLKTVIFDQFVCTFADMSFIQYVLQNSKVLEMMDVHFDEAEEALEEDSDDEDGNQAWILTTKERIDFFEQESKACKVTYSCGI